MRTTRMARILALAGGLAGGLTLAQTVEPLAPEPGASAATATPLQPVPAQLPEGPLSCADATSRAMRADLKVTQTRNADLAQLIALQDAALAQWRIAIGRCEGRARERAQRVLADNERSRQRLAEREEAGAQCELTLRDAQSVQELAQGAFGERRWPDAAALYRKAETLWDLAAEHCTGEQQQTAAKRRATAEIDAFNAEECGPGFERARELFAKLRAMPGSAQPADRERASQVAETAWRQNVQDCQGPAQDLARSNAEAIARERGTPWVATAAPNEAPARVAAGSGFATAAAPVEVPAESAPAEAGAGSAASTAAAGGAKAALAAAASVGAVAAAGAAAESGAAGPGLLERAGALAGAALKTVREALPTVTAAAAPLAGAAATAAVSGTTSAAAGGAAAALPVAALAAPLTKLLTPASEAAGEAARAAPTPAAAGNALNPANPTHPTAGAGAEPPALPAGEVDLRAGSARYQGRFALDAERRFAGEGQVQWDHGDRYEGRLLAGKRHGKGRFTWSNGQQFEGDWVDDQPQGLGRLRYANGDVYDGQIKDGKPEGLGEMRYLRGDQFRGLFRDGSPNGRGLYRWANGQSFEGDWIGLTPQGKGVLRFANGNVYEGEVRNGLPEGHGRMRFFNGGEYEGGFKAGLNHGLGRYLWPGGDRYEGAWVDGKKHGQGTFFFASGERWVGRFEDDERSDDGVFHGNAPK